MSNTTILQVPIDRTIKQKAAMAASDYGFSSLQEIVRVILSKLAKKELVVSIAEKKEERLSPQAEKRYLKMIEDIKNGKTKNFYPIDNVGDIMKFFKK